MTKKLDVNDCSFDHLTLILLLHYLVTDVTKFTKAIQFFFILAVRRGY